MKKIKMENLNYFMLILLIIKSMLHYSVFFQLPIIVENCIELIAYIFWFITLLSKNYSKKKILLIFLVGILILWSSYKCQNYILVSSFMLFCLTLFSDQDKIVKIIFRTLFAILLLHFLYFIFIYFNVDINVVVDTTGRIRYGLGFINPNIVSYYILWTYIAYLYLSSPSVFFKRILSFVPVLISFFFTKSNTLLIMSLFSLLIFSLKDYKFNKKLINFGCKYLFVIVSILIIIFINSYKIGSSLGLRVDKILNNRIYYSYIAQENYGYTLFGQRVNLDLNLEREQSYMSKSVILDVTYSNLMFRYGLIYILIFILLCRNISLKGTYNEKKSIIIWIIFALSEVVSLNFLICFPMIFAAKYTLKLEGK